MCSRDFKNLKKYYFLFLIDHISIFKKNQDKKTINTAETVCSTSTKRRRLLSHKSIMNIKFHRTNKTKKISVN